MICLYNKIETDFSHNGVCVLEPSVCEVSEHAGGSYELYMEHPFDKNGKYLAIAERMIIKAPVPKTIIPETILPEKTTYTVSTVDSFYQKLPVAKHKKTERDALATIRANPSFYQYASGRGFNSGSYCIYNGGIYVATDFTISETPGLSGSSWRWVAALNGGGSGGGDTTYTPGVAYSPGLTQGQIVTKLADYSETIVQIKDQLGRIGFYTKSNLTVSTTAQEVIPEQEITDQLFRIYDIESEEETGVLIVYARHISYDFQGNKMMACNLVETEVNNAIAVMQGNLMIPDSRRIACQFEDVNITHDWSFKNPISALLDPDDGLVPELNARLIRNNKDFFILRNDNPRVGPAIEYGINLKGVNWQRNDETTISRVVPRCKTGKDDHLFLEHGGTWVDGEWVANDDIFVDSPIASEFPEPKIEVLDCAYSVGEKYTPAGSNTEIERTEASCRAEMLKDAQKRFTEDHCDGIEISLSVDFLLIGDTEQYKQYRGLQRVNLYDIIPVRTETYQTQAQVSAYKYDSILERYISVDVGKISDFAKRMPGFRVVNESITYSKLSPELISMIRNMGATGDTTGASAGEPTSGGVVVETEVIDNLTSTSTTAALSANQGKVLKNAVDGKQDKIPNGSFTYACSAGQNLIRANSSFVSGSFPNKDIRYCVFTVWNHGTTQNSPNTVEVDSTDTIIINAKAAQNISVRWFYLGK